MRVDEDKKLLELTERNLRVLLAKLSGHPEDSACTIYNDGWNVKSVPNDEHYSGRQAGYMHPESVVAGATVTQVHPDRSAWDEVLPAEGFASMLRDERELDFREALSLLLEAMSYDKGPDEEEFHDWFYRALPLMQRWGHCEGVVQE